MKLIHLIFLIMILTLSSCRSEYERHLEEALVLREQLTVLENQYYISPSSELHSEIVSIEKEIRVLAMISGHEELFLAEISLEE